MEAALRSDHEVNHGREPFRGFSLPIRPILLCEKSLWDPDTATYLQKVSQLHTLWRPWHFLFLSTRAQGSRPCRGLVSSTRCRDYDTSQPYRCKLYSLNRLTSRRPVSSTRRGYADASPSYNESNDSSSCRHLQDHLLHILWKNTMPFSHSMRA